MKKFSERKGLKPVSEIIQVDSMTAELRNSLWNVLEVALWSRKDFVHRNYGTPPIYLLGRSLWSSYFKKTIDSCPHEGHEILKIIRDYFFSCKWYEVYDFLEFIVSAHEASRLGLAESFNVVLERELSGYRFAAGYLVNVTNQEEIEMIEEAARDSKFAGVSAHIDRALELYADRENPDFRNSIKESISAVESIARVVFLATSLGPLRRFILAPCKRASKSLIPGHLLSFLGTWSGAEPEGRSAGRCPQKRAPSLLPPSLLLRQRPTKAVGLLARLDDVSAVGNAIQQRLT